MIFNRIDHSQRKCKSSNRFLKNLRSSFSTHLDVTLMMNIFQNEYLMRFHLNKYHKFCSNFNRFFQRIIILCLMRQ